MNGGSTTCCVALDLQHHIEQIVKQLLPRHALAHVDDGVQKRVEVLPGIRGGSSIGSRACIEHGQTM